MTVKMVLLWIILSGSALWDLKTHRIPNRFLAFGIPACWAGGLWEAVCGTTSGAEAVQTLINVSLSWAWAFLAAVVLLFPLFWFRMIGAGDIKITALICGCLGLRAGMTAAGCGFLIGAFQALWILRRRGSFLRRFSYFFAYFRQYFRTNEKLAYFNPERDGYEDTLYLAPCLWAGTTLYLLIF